MLTTAIQKVYSVQVSCFSLERTLDCGQCFRWERLEDGTWQGVAAGRLLHVGQQGDTLTFYRGGKEWFEGFEREYFDLDRDYRAIDRLLCLDERLEQAAECARGIHILRQDPWEALCSFIISQNNNIPRIKGIVSRLCEAFGEEIESGVYSFPAAEDLAGRTVEELAPLRSGFRAKYLIDAAGKVAGGQVNLEALRAMELDEARGRLCTIKGVGPKVAECALLYGLGRMECFPVDVWIARVMKKLFPEGLPKEFEPVAGFAQQYLFHYGRIHKITEK